VFSLFFYSTAPRETIDLDLVNLIDDEPKASSRALHAHRGGVETISLLDD